MRLIGRSLSESGNVSIVLIHTALQPLHICRLCGRGRADKARPSLSSDVGLAQLVERAGKRREQWQRYPCPPHTNTPTTGEHRLSSFARQSVLFVCASVRLFICLSVHVSVCLSICLCVCLSVFGTLSLQACAVYRCVHSLLGAAQAL